ALGCPVDGDRIRIAVAAAQKRHVAVDARMAGVDVHVGARDGPRGRHADPSGLRINTWSTVDPIPRYAGGMSAWPTSTRRIVLNGARRFKAVPRPVIGCHARDAVRSRPHARSTKR